MQNSNDTNLDSRLSDEPYYSETSGFYWASNHYGLPECVPQHVKHIISNEELEIKSNQEQIQVKIDRLVSQKNELEAQKEQHESEIEEESQDLAGKKEELARLQIQLQAPTEAELKPSALDDNKPIKQSKGELILQAIFPTFTTFALIGLLCYLFVFYSSAGDKAFSSSTGSVQQQLNEIVNHAALFQAWQAGNWFVLLFPFIFLILAIITHLSWEHREYMGWLLGPVLFVTLILDTVIAIKISQRVHDDKIVRGLLEESHRWTIFDLNILAVLLLGFAISLLLSFALYWTVQLWGGIGALQRQSKEQELRGLPVEIQAEKVQREAQIAVLKTQMENLQNEIDPLNEKAQTVQQKIDQNQVQIEELFELQNKRFVNAHQIESRVSQFLKGWCRFVVHNGNGDTDVPAQIDKIQRLAHETINQYYENSQSYFYQS